MSTEEALSDAIDNLNQYIKSNKERTAQLEGERTSTRYLLERMNNDLIKMKIKSNDDDYVSQLRMLNNKVDNLMTKTNDMKADYQQQYNRLEGMLTKIIVTLKHI